MTSRTLHTVDDIVVEGFAPRDNWAGLTAVADRFSVAVTPIMAKLIDKKAVNDPIARQFIPHVAELDVAPEELADPTDDVPFAAVKGLVHRYPDRVLLKPTHTCAVYCRFCFRREKVGVGSETLTERELSEALQYIRDRPQIWEVIVSGGDPWILSPRRLKWIVTEIGTIPHVGVIRFHTRVPVVDPSRVNDALIAALTSETMVWVVVHANHPSELTQECRDACGKLRRAGIPMLAQTVLLKGVNDDPETLERLFRNLISIGVKPYYLHQGDFAKGTSHFRTTIACGQEIMKSLRGRVSGICQPTYVVDIPGARGKVPISHSYAQKIAGTDNWAIEDIDGNVHNYPPGV